MATSAQVSADQKLRELLDIMIEESDPNLLVTLSLMRYCKVQAISCFLKNDYVIFNLVAKSLVLMATLQDLNRCIRQVACSADGSSYNMGHWIN